MTTSLTPNIKLGMNQTFSSQANALFAAMTTPPTAGRKVLINNFINQLVNNGYWGNIDVLQVMAAETEQAGQLNWKNPGTNTITIVNAPTFTVDRGYTFDGVNQSADTNFNPTSGTPALTQNANFIFCWELLNVQSANSQCGWQATSGFTLASRGTTDNYAMRVSQTAATISSNNTDGTGLYAAIRTGSAATRMFKNGANSTVNSGANQTSTALVNHNFLLGTSNLSGFRNCKLAIFGCGGGITVASTRDAFMATLYGAANAYLQAVGAV
jgi:hypothetical protein